MIKTKSHIQSFIVNGGSPKSAGSPIVVRAPKHLRCFRATIIVSNFGSTGEDLDSGLYISTYPVTSIEQCIFLSTVIGTDMQVAPTYTLGNSSIKQLVLDRRGVGYMDDELYFYSDKCYVSIIWEGEINE